MIALPALYVSRTLSLILRLKKQVSFMDASFEPQLFCKTCDDVTTRDTRYCSDNEFIGKIIVCEHCGETVFEPLRMGCADC